MAKQGTLFDLPPLPDARPVTFAPVRNKIWTEQKAKLISRYLYLFVLITKHGNYIDGFAGPQYTDRKDAWTARLVLESEPRWLNGIFLCDNDPAQITAIERLVNEQPRSLRRRTVEVFDGDFNKCVNEILASEMITDTRATFCLFDQRTFECDWATVQAVAGAKQGAEKIELMYFVPTGWFGRSVAGLKLDKPQRMRRWWGNDDWKKLIGLNIEECAETFRARFLTELGYKYVSRWPIYSREFGRGRTMYHLIHATDHREAPYLMGRAYRTATKAPPPEQQLLLDFKELQRVLDSDA